MIQLFNQLCHIILNSIVCYFCFLYLITIFVFQSFENANDELFSKFKKKSHQGIEGLSRFYPHAQTEEAGKKKAKRKMYATSRTKRKHLVILNNTFQEHGKYSAPTNHRIKQLKEMKMVKSDISIQRSWNPEELHQAISLYCDEPITLLRPAFDKGSHLKVLKTWDEAPNAFQFLTQYQRGNYIYVFKVCINLI